MSKVFIEPMLSKGKTSLTPEKLATIHDWYEIALRDAEKSMDALDISTYMGAAEAYNGVLNLLYSSKKAVVAKAPLIVVDKKAVIITGVVVYILLKKRAKNRRKNA